MNIVILEDEVKATKSLARLIAKLRPAARIVAKLQRIEGAIDYFSNHEHPNLIFMDIQLSDGLCFEIFKKVTIRCPIVFCTAYGEYAMEAIKANGIDYLLKPFSENELNAAFEKMENFKNFFQQNTKVNLEELLKKGSLNEGKKSFLIFKNGKYMTIQTDQIAYIYIKYASPSIITLQGYEYAMNQSLDQIQNQLSANHFFRLNRQYLVQFSAIKDVEHYFARKLFVRLVIPTPEKLLVGKDKATAFLQWLENR